MGERRSFVRGAAILALAGVSSRFFGAVGRVVLAGAIGDEGIGLYQMAYPVYSLFLALSTAGLPVAISKMVSERTAVGDPRGARRVLRVALVVLSATGVLAAALLLGFTRTLAVRVMRDARAVYCLLAVAPALLILPVVSAFRGFFQGLQRMAPSAVSQALDQAARVACMLVLAYLLLPSGVQYAAAGASAGAFVGGLAALAYLVAAYVSTRAGGGGSPAASSGPGQGLPGLEPVWPTVYGMFALSLPIVVGASIMPILQVADAFLVPQRLHAAGYAETTGLYGQLSGMAMPLVYFPTTATLALAASIVPAVAEAQAVGDRRAVVSRGGLALRFSMLLGLPSSVGLAVLARQICQMLYRVPEAGAALAVVSLGTAFVCVQQASTGILQGLGLVGAPVRNLALGMGVKVIANYVLVAVPGVGIRGAALGSVLGFGVACILNLLTLWRTTGIGIDPWRSLFLPLSASLVAGIGARGAYEAVEAATASNTLGVLAGVVSGVGAYGLSLILTRSLTAADLEPLGGRASRVTRRLERLGLIASGPARNRKGG